MGDKRYAVRLHYTGYYLTDDGRTVYGPAAAKLYATKGDAVRDVTEYLPGIPYCIIEFNVSDESPRVSGLDFHNTI